MTLRCKFFVAMSQIFVRDMLRKHIPNVFCHYKHNLGQNWSIFLYWQINIWYHVVIQTKEAKMSESRNNYKKTDIKLNLVNALRAHYMTREDIRNFLSDEYKRLGKTPINCKNIVDYKVSERTVKRTIDSIKDSYGDQLEEEAGAYKKLQETLSLTQEELSKRLGKSRSHITNMLGLLSLPEKIQDDVNSKIITMGHARVLSKLDDAKQQIELENRIINEGLSVRQ